MLGSVGVIDEVGGPAAADAVGRGANGPGMVVSCLMLSLALLACGRVGFERLQRDGGGQQGFDASVDGPGDAGTMADSGTVEDSGTLVACAPTDTRDCLASSANVFPTGLNSITVSTGAQADQWSSSCGGLGTGDNTIEMTVEGNATYRFEFSGGADAAISIRDGDCTGPELACGLGAVEVSATAGQVLLVHVEGAADSTCISGQLMYGGL